MKFIKQIIKEDIKVGNILFEKGDIIYKEIDTKDIKSENPGITDLPENAWNNWSIEKLVNHMVSQAKSKGREAISKAIMNIERWNKNDDPELSKKARSVFDKYASILDKE